MSAEIDSIKDRLDVAEVLGDYISLKQAGRHFKALCPFHQEKTPSLVISPEKGIWHCFGCHKGGDIFSFVQEIEGIEFASALKMLAERAGVELQSHPKESTDRRQRLFDLLSLTSRFYHEILVHQAVGKKAQEYLAERGVAESTWLAFSLGYAPQAWDTLQSFLRSRGYSPQEMLAAGVVGESARGTLYDRFRGRIIFPIADLQGRVVAFGGRITPWHMTGEEGKYINSPETDLYQKRRVVYNLDRAKQHLRHGEPCIVVEGYMDVVMLDQAGVHNVVASSGTAFTQEATAQLARYTKRLHFAFDADAAGFAAAVAASQVTLQQGMRVAALVLPEGKDPADVVLETKGEVATIFRTAQPLTTVLLDKLRSSGMAEERDGYLRELLPLVAMAKNPVFQGEMIQDLAAALHISEARLLQELERSSFAAPVPLAAGRPPALALNLDLDVSLSPDQYILGILITDSPTRKKMLSSLQPGFILDKQALALYNVLHGLTETDPSAVQASADELLDRLPDALRSYGEVVRRLAEERLHQSKGDPLIEAEAVLRVIKRHALERQLAALQQKLSESEGAERQKTLQAFNKLTEQLSTY